MAGWGRFGERRNRVAEYLEAFIELKEERKMQDARLQPLQESWRTGKFTGGPGDYERTIEAGGMDRRYEVHLPATYTRDNIP